MTCAAGCDILIYEQLVGRLAQVVVRAHSVSVGAGVGDNQYVSFTGHR